MDLAEFLLARVDEIDPLRGRLSDNLPHHPYCAGMAVDDYGEQYEFRPDLCDCGVPQRVLAECAAKRAIVAEHATQDVPVLEVHGKTIMSGPECRVCVDWDEVEMDGPPPVTAPCRTLRLLAQIFADHPDYLPEWTLVKA